MPKRISDSKYNAIKRAFLRGDRQPTYAELARRFNVSSRSIERRAVKENWQDERSLIDEANQAGQDKAVTNISIARGRKIDQLEALEGAISDLYAKSGATDAKSAEGCANAMANLMKVKRELFPPNADDLAEIAFKLNIKPQDFIDALKRRWDAAIPEAHQAEATGSKV